SEKESLEYLKYRIKMAGGNPSAIFSSSALKKIIVKSKGIPRRLNILSDNALITGFGYQKKPVTGRIVNEIVKDLDGNTRRKVCRKWVPISLTVLILVVAAGFARPYKTVLFDFFRMSMQESQPSTSASTIAKVVKPTVTPIQTPVNNEQPPRETLAVVKEQAPTTVAKIPRTPEKRKTVVQGDTLTKLANEIYGKADGEIIGAVQGKNPQITDPNLIQAGSTIIFPDLPQQNRPETN
ncbi:MAG TPA: hypothetical protein VHO84_01390, partial [Syntrophorhabdaceae bacterium]|nr:hypothetical protein [Syntrophorhabdaceae bacterium]